MAGAVALLAGEKEARDLARAARVDVVDVTSGFCFDTSCPPVVDGCVLYADHHHLTQTYVR